MNRTGVRQRTVSAAGGFTNAMVRSSVRRWVASLYLLVLVPTLAASELTGQTGVLRGRVVDSDSAAVYAALVELRASPDGPLLRAAETDALGTFFFGQLQPGTYEVSAGRLGFARAAVTAEVSANEPRSVILVLALQALGLEGFNVQAERSRDRARFEGQAGMTVRDLAADEIKLIPGLAEADPLRAIAVLPGVVSTSDFSSAFNVRGGSADQNLVLLDGTPIFNPFHLGGLFSVFNADMVSRAELFAGAFPAEYGGRVSSVLDVATDPGVGRRKVDLGVSLLAARAAVGGGLPEGLQSKLGLATARWRVSGRRSYFDVLLSPFFQFPYHLTDLQGVFEGWTPGGSRITVSGYTGSDVITLSELEEDDVLRVDWRWGNDVIGATWSHLHEGGSRTELRTGFSRFDTELGFPDFADVEFRSEIDVWTSALRLERRMGTEWTVVGGVTADRYAYDNRVASGGTEFRRGLGTGWLLGGYLQGKWSVYGRWLLELGTRVDSWVPDPGSRTTKLAPRVAAKRFFGSGDWAAKAAVGRFTQFLHSVRDEELPVGLDVWVLAGERAPPVVSDQVQLGVEGYPAEDWFTSLDVYARNFQGVTTPNFADDTNDPLDDLLAGEGFAYGADLFIRKSGEGTSGWLSLSLLQTDRTFPDFVSGLDPAPDVSYPPIFDRRIDVDLVLRRPLRWGVEGGLRWNFGSGLPFTRPQGAYTTYTRGLADPRLFWDQRTFSESVALGPRNGERYPAYHRLDISFRRPSTKTWGTITPYLDILNVYNRKNVLFYFFEFDNDPPTRSGVSMLPLLPTIGVEISF